MSLSTNNSGASAKFSAAPHLNTRKNFTDSNIGGSNKKTSNSESGLNNTLKMQAQRRSPKTNGKLSSRSQHFSTKTLSARLRKRLMMIKEISASVGEEPIVKVSISSISGCFICSICNGYLYKATTITECLHTFCKSCIVKHLAYNLNCPKCNILIHPTDPLVNLRTDSIIQDLLYKLLPQVENEEALNEEIFFEKMKQNGIPVLKVDPYRSNGIPTHQRKYFKRKALKESKAEKKENYHVGFEINLLGCCINNFTVEPPYKAYFCLPISLTMRDAQKFIEDKLKIPSETQINFFIGGYLINPSTGIEKLWNAFSDGDVLENFLSVSYAIMPIKDYFNDGKIESSI